MHWLIAALAGIAFVELLLRLPVLSKLGDLRATLFRVPGVIRSARISDHWKERALLRYASRLLRLTGLLALYLAATVVPFGAVWLVSITTGGPVLEFTLSPVGILYVTVVSMGYAGVRFGRIRKRL